MEPQDPMAHSLEHAPYLAFAPLLDHDTESGRTGRRGVTSFVLDFRHRGDARPVFQDHSATQPGESRLPDRPCYRDKVLLLHVVARMEQTGGELTIVREHQQPRAVQVE